MIRAFLVLVFVVGLVVPAWADATLTAGTGSGEPDDAVSITITLDTDEELRGFSFGLSHDDTVAILDDIVQGSDVSDTNDGSGPDYFNMSVDPAGGPGGYVGCIIDLNLVEELPAVDGQEIVVFEYTVDTDATGGGATDLTFTDDLGDPPVATVVVPANESIVPTTVDGSIDVLAPPDPDIYTFAAAIEAIDDGLLATISILEDSDNPTYPTDTRGFTMQFEHEFENVDVSTIGEIELSEVVIVDSVEGGTSVEVLYYFDDIMLVAFDLEKDVLEVELTGDGPDCPPETETTVVTFSNSLIGLDDNTVNAVDSTEAVLVLFEDGVYTCPAQFIRGDVNGDGVIVGLVDAIQLLCGVFLDCDLPCDDAADCDDDGTVSGIVDATFLLDYTYGGGPAPDAPTECGVDPTDDLLDCSTPDGCL